MSGIPTISPVSAQGMLINSQYSKLYNNPHFDYLSEMLPKDIKDMFRWCELVYHSMPTIANGIRKLVNYPVTDFSFLDAPEDIRKSTKNLLNSLKMKVALLDFGNDSYVYGNVFRTVYFPFKRFLVCSHCQERTAIEHAKFKVKGQHFHLTCRCGHTGKAELHDEDIHDVRLVRIVRWDPKCIELRQNPITGRTEYYYDIPKSVVKAIKAGDVAVLCDTPKVFVESALRGRQVKMGNNFFHARNPALSGFSSGWGISPLMSTLKQYMYIAVLRRASEAIGMDHITPKQILFPQQNGSYDPSIASSLDRWNQELTSAIERWRYDPNYVMLAPYPTGFTNIGSQGRALTPTEEVKDARLEMGLALDIPPSLIMGDANIQNSAVGLRILENQLTPHIENLEDFANWVIDAINVKFGTQYAHVELVPFKLADDIMNKQILAQSQGSGTVSRATLQESLNLDPDRERDRIREEQLADHDMQVDLQREIERRTKNISQMAQDQEQASMSGTIPRYNQQEIIAKAQELAMQLGQLPYEQRRSALAQLQNEDYIMWSVVSKQIESMREQAKTRQPQA